MGVAMVSAWCELFGRGVLADSSRESQALARAGVALRPRDGDGRGPGLVLFDESGEALYDHVRGLSDHGSGRVLAIALHPTALAGGAGWRLLQAGASDVLAWSGPADLACAVALRLERWEQVDRVVNNSVVRDHLVGQGPAWLSLMRQIVEVARFTDASILITGESGTGKELVARLVHTLDPRSDKKDLVVLDCTTVVPELSGSEFFGHERGAFTGAVATREGAFALADGGTLFLVHPLLDDAQELALERQRQVADFVDVAPGNSAAGSAHRRHRLAELPRGHQLVAHQRPEHQRRGTASQPQLAEAVRVRVTRCGRARRRRRALRRGDPGARDVHRVALVAGPGGPQQRDAGARGQDGPSAGHARRPADRAEHASRALSPHRRAAGHAGVDAARPARLRPRQRDLGRGVAPEREAGASRRRRGEDLQEIVIVANGRDEEDGDHGQILR